MQKPTGVYLQALRSRDYLLFLQWPQAISSSNTDLLIECLLQGWLQQGYEKTDAHCFALLYQLMTLHQELFSPDLQYAVSLLASVFIKILELKEFDEDPSMAIGQFNQWIDEVTLTEINDTLSRLTPILNLRQHAMDYLVFLEGLQETENDVLYVSRLSLAQRLVKYTHEETQLSADVIKEVTFYLMEIRALGPSSAEENYLMRIITPSVLDTAKRWFTGLAINFFHLIQSPVIDEQHIEQKPK